MIKERQRKSESITLDGQSGPNEREAIVQFIKHKAKAAYYDRLSIYMSLGYKTLSNTRRQCAAHVKMKALYFACACFGSYSLNDVSLLVSTAQTTCRIILNFFTISNFLSYTFG